MILFCTLDMLGLLLSLVDSLMGILGNKLGLYSMVGKVCIEDIELKSGSGHTGTVGGLTVN